MLALASEREKRKVSVSKSSYNLLMANKKAITAAVSVVPADLLSVYQLAIPAFSLRHHMNTQQSTPEPAANRRFLLSAQWWADRTTFIWSSLS